MFPIRYAPQNTPRERVHPGVTQPLGQTNMYMAKRLYPKIRDLVY